MFSQINTEINAQVYMLCQNIVKNFNSTETNSLYKMWVNSLPKEITDISENDENNEEDKN